MTQESQAPNIAVCTRNRPAGLSRLLMALNAELTDYPVEPKVIVIDNSDGATARDVVLSLPFGAAISYVHAPQGGLATARNRALDLVTPDAAIIFIDDDEEPRRGWYRAFVAAQNTYPGCVLAGPVAPRYSNEPATWMRRLGENIRHTYRHGDTLPYVGGGNTLLPPQLHKGLHLRYNPQYDFTGGEDTDLFIRWTSTGGQIRWVEGASVDEDVSRDRMTARYFVLRKYRQAKAFTWITATDGRSAATRLARAAGRCIHGLTLVLGGLATLRKDRLARGLADIGQFIATVAALCSRPPMARPSTPFQH